MPQPHDKIFTYKLVGKHEKKEQQQQQRRSTRWEKHKENLVEDAQDSIAKNSADPLALTAIRLQGMVSLEGFNISNKVKKQELFLCLM